MTGRCYEPRQVGTAALQKEVQQHHEVLRLNSSKRRQGLGTRSGCRKASTGQVRATTRPLPQREQGFLGKERGKRASCSAPIVLKHLETNLFSGC